MTPPVSDIMTRDLVVLEEWQNLVDVSKDFERYAIRHLPVVDGGRLVGLISHRDLLRFAATMLDGSPVRDARDAHIKEQTFVAAVMTRDVTTVGPETPIKEAAEKILAARFGALPVVDDEGKLVGLVSEHDLLKHYATNS